jgi:hypothetical protein
MRSTAHAYVHSPLFFFFCRQAFAVGFDVLSDEWLGGRSLRSYPPFLLLLAL